MNFRLFLVVLVLHLSIPSNVCGIKGDKSAGVKAKELLEWNEKSAIIEINDQRYKEYVKGAKNYSVVVLFTARSPKFKCAVCKEVLDEYMAAAYFYRHSPSYSSKLFFAIADYENAPKTFTELALNRVPVLMFFPAGTKSVEKLEIEQLPELSAHAIAKWLSKVSDVYIDIPRSSKYLPQVSTILLVLFTCGFAYLKRNNLQFLQNSEFWATSSIVFVLAMISGQMWNSIRSPPMMMRTKNGQLTFIHHSSQSQLVAETYVVLLLNGLIVLGMVLLAESNKVFSKRGKFVMASTGTTIVIVFFSLLLYVFRSKMYGYPYKLIF